MDSATRFSNGVIVSDDSFDAAAHACLEALKNALPEEARFYDVATIVLEQCKALLGTEARL